MITIKGRRKKAFYFVVMKPKHAGAALLTFVLLLLFTMVLHPAGGSIQHLQAVSVMIVLTHGIAILSLPFGAIGFLGLTQHLGLGDFFARTGFAAVAFALIAVMMAAAANGLVLPMLIKDTTAPDPLMRYTHYVNSAFDYIYTAFFSLAMLFWSIAMLRSHRLPAWYAYAGLVLCVAGPTIILFGLAPATLTGVRFFFAAIALWIALVARSLMYGDQGA